MTVRATEPPWQASLKTRTRAKKLIICPDGFLRSSGIRVFQSCMKISRFFFMWCQRSENQFTPLLFSNSFSFLIVICGCLVAYLLLFLLSCCLVWGEDVGHWDSFCHVADNKAGPSREPPFMKRCELAKRLFGNSSVGTHQFFSSYTWALPVTTPIEFISWTK